MPITLNKKKKKSEPATTEAAAGEAQTNVTKSKSGATIEATATVETVPAATNEGHQETPDGMAMVSVELGTTINTGDFENVKVLVKLDMPTPPENIDEAFAFTAHWVETKMSELSQKAVS